MNEAELLEVFQDIFKLDTYSQIINILLNFNDKHIGPEKNERLSGLQKTNERQLKDGFYP